MYDHIYTKVCLLNCCKLSRHEKILRHVTYSSMAAEKPFRSILVRNCRLVPFWRPQSEKKTRPLVLLLGGVQTATHHRLWCLRHPLWTWHLDGEKKSMTFSYLHDMFRKLSTSPMWDETVHSPLAFEFRSFSNTAIKSDMQRAHGFGTMIWPVFFALFGASFAQECGRSRSYVLYASIYFRAIVKSAQLWQFFYV